MSAERARASRCTSHGARQAAVRRRLVRRRVTYACVLVSAVVHSVSATPGRASGGSGSAAVARSAGLVLDVALAGRGLDEERAVARGGAPAGAARAAAPACGPSRGRRGGGSRPWRGW